MTGFDEGPDEPCSAAELLARSRRLAAEVLGMTEADKDHEMARLKRENPVMHSLVKDRLRETRREARGDRTSEEG